MENSYTVYEMGEAPKDFFEDRPKLNIFDKIRLWWKFDGRAYHKEFVRSVKKLYYWFPIIRKDRDWDGHYIYEVIKHKLKAQANYIGTNDRHTRAQQDARRMRICVKLIEKIQDDFYQLEYADYAKDKHWFEPCKDKEGYSEWKSSNVWEKYEDYFKKYPLIYKQVMVDKKGPFTLSGNTDTNFKQRVAMNIAHLNHDRARKLLFKIMEENIEGWWD
jgi:hypothetical protein